MSPQFLRRQDVTVIVVIQGNLFGCNKNVNKVQDLLSKNSAV